MANGIKQGYGAYLPSFSKEDIEDGNVDRHTLKQVQIILVKQDHYSQTCYIDSLKRRKFDEASSFIPVIAKVLSSTDPRG